MDSVTVTIDVTSCDSEPIHIPGSIQPHGIMLVVGKNDLVVLHGAGQVDEHLGGSGWEGRKLTAIIGDKLATAVSQLGRPGATGGFIGRLGASNGVTLDVSAHPTGPYILIEFEPASTIDVPAPVLLDQLSEAAARFERTPSVVALCDRAAIEFRRLTGFDRVMIYRFLENGAGRVVAEDRMENAHSFLHHHFPESDIPAQARALYVRNRIRVIPDATYRPAPLRPAWNAVPPLDMSDSILRSVSPVHLQYLHNMDVRASASVSIVKDGVLWGLIACHHKTPRTLSYGVRAACRTLAGGLARQIAANEDAEGYRQRIRLRGLEDEMIALLSREGSLGNALSNHLGALNRMMGGDGVAVLRGSELVMSGVHPSEQEIRDLAAWLLTHNAGTTFSTDRLSTRYPAGASFEQTGSGVLATVVSADGPWILFWFRAEQAETVNWAGNPHKSSPADAQEPLTPRASFDTWQEIVKGHARNWTMPEVEATVRLRIALLEVEHNRHVRELNGALAKIIQDKDILLQQNVFLIGEVNHRIQNSLHIVSGYIALQAKGSNDPAVHGAFEEARRRINAVSLVHRRLYRAGQVEFVDAALYIEELCADTFSFTGADWARYLTLNLSPATISTDRAVTIGLLITELIINVNKHAYGGVAGPIEIALTHDMAQLRLVVSDNGAGRVFDHEGFGSRIVEGLAAQLRSTIEYIDNNPGLRTIITMPAEVFSNSGSLTAFPS